MVRKNKTEKQLIKQLLVPSFKGLKARQVRAIAKSKKNIDSKFAKKELRKRGLKLSGPSNLF